MSVLTSHALVGVSYDGTIIPCSGGNISFEISEVAAGAGQGIFNTVAALKQVGGKVSITTPALDIAYGALGEHAPIAAGTPLILYFAKRIQGGIYEAAEETDDHISVTCYNGVIVWSGLSASHNEIAQMTYEATLASDGAGGDPITLDYAALPTDIGLALIFTSGQVKIKSTFYDVSQMSYDPGYAVVREGAGGLPWSTMVAVKMGQASGSFTVQGAAIITELTEIGKYEAASIFYFRAFDGTNANGRVPPGAPTHFKIALGKAIYMPQSMSGAWTETTSFPVRVVPYSNPTTIPVVAPHAVTVAAAIV